MNPEPPVNSFVVGRTGDVLGLDRFLGGHLDSAGGRRPAAGMSVAA